MAVELDKLSQRKVLKQIGTPKGIEVEILTRFWIFSRVLILDGWELQIIYYGHLNSLDCLKKTDFQISPKHEHIMFGNTYEINIFSKLDPQAKSLC